MKQPRVQNEVVYKEDQLQMVVKNLLPVQQKHLFAQYFPSFKALVVVGTQIEDAIQVRTIKINEFPPAKVYTSWVKPKIP